MPQTLIALGIVGGVVSIGSFSGAVRETFKLQSLRALYNSVVAEEIPVDMAKLVDSLGDE